MSRENSNTQKTLTEIFSKVNMSELPAMSDHVKELISLLNRNDVKAQELAAVILKDASLTTKILQVVNSAYYSRGVPVTSVSRAITAVGLGTLRELATTLALFEDFLKAGVEKDEISKVLTKSFLSATQAKILCKVKKLKAPEEEVFICALLHELGKIIILVYMPELYRKIIELVERGYSDEYAAKMILSDLTFTQVGMEIARFWNFSEKIVLSMTKSPPQPANKFDSQLYILNLSAFCNSLTRNICYGSELEFSEIMLHYSKMFSLNKQECFALVARSIDVAEDMSAIIRFGLSKLKLRAKLAQRMATA